MVQVARPLDLLRDQVGHPEQAGVELSANQLVGRPAPAQRDLPHGGEAVSMKPASNIVHSGFATSSLIVLRACSGTSTAPTAVARVMSRRSAALRGIRPGDVLHGGIEPKTIFAWAISRPSTARISSMTSLDKASSSSIRSRSFRSSALRRLGVLG